MNLNLRLDGKRALAAGGNSGIGAAVTFALAGCSALLPLTIRFAQQELATIAFYEVGYRLAAFGFGPRQSAARLGWKVNFGGITTVAFAMAAMAVVVTRKPVSHGAIA